MVSSEIAKKIKHIQIYTRRLLNGSLVGDKNSAIKGSGLDFDQIREYQQGDDIRFIDWKATARTGEMLVKQCIEERNRNVILMVDVSGSQNYASTDSLKFHTIAEIASVLALVADHGKDHVSLVLFSDQIEKVLPLKRGAYHVQALMKALWEYKITEKTTDLNVALDYLGVQRIHDAVVFLLSDFIDDGFEKKLRFSGKKYDVIAIRCLDSFEDNMIAGCFLTMRDSETGQLVSVDSRKGNITDQLHKRIEDQSMVFKKSGVPCIDIVAGKPFISDIVTFFRRRMMY
jgi:uncharacterized protein (DUF58 family)